MDLSLDKKDFKKNVKNLRENLNEIKKTGILEEDFEEKLEEIKKLEEKLLKDLIPYYRENTKDINKDKIEIIKLKEIGSIYIKGFLEKYLKINDNLYIISSSKKEVYFIYINKNLEIEISLPLEEIKDNIAYFYKINNNEIFIMTLKGKTYKILIKNLEKLPNIKNDLEIIEIKNNFVDNFMGRSISLGKDIFLTESSESRINLFKLNSEINYFKDIYIDIENWTTFEKVKENHILVGTKDGKLYSIKFSENKFYILEKLEFDFNIRKIKVLEDESLIKNKVLILGDKGNLKILEIDEKINILKSFDNLKGNLFDVDSNRGTAIILSEDGVLYTIEENLGKWHLNKNYKKDLFYTNIIAKNNKEYLAMNLDLKFDLIKINRVTTAEDLWKVDLI